MLSALHCSLPCTISPTPQKAYSYFFRITLVVLGLLSLAAAGLLLSGLYGHFDLLYSVGLIATGVMFLSLGSYVRCLKKPGRKEAITSSEPQTKELRATVTELKQKNQQKAKARLEIFTAQLDALDAQIKGVQDELATSSSSIVFPKIATCKRRLQEATKTFETLEQHNSIKDAESITKRLAHFKASIQKMEDTLMHLVSKKRGE